MVIAITIVGRSRRPVRRSGARPGDWIGITGPTGESALGLKLLLAGETAPPSSAATSTRSPRCEKGLLLARLRPRHDRRVRRPAARPFAAAARLGRRRRDRLREAPGLRRLPAIVPAATISPKRSWSWPAARTTNCCSPSRRARNAACAGRGWPTTSSAGSRARAPAAAAGERPAPERPPPRLRPLRRPNSGGKEMKIVKKNAFRPRATRLRRHPRFPGRADRPSSGGNSRSCNQRRAPKSSRASAGEALVFHSLEQQRLLLLVGAGQPGPPVRRPPAGLQDDVPAARAPRPPRP